MMWNGVTRRGIAGQVRVRQVSAWRGQESPGRVGRGTARPGNAGQGKVSCEQEAWRCT